VDGDEPIGYDEISLKAAHWSTPTVNARLHECFSEVDASSAAVILAGLVGEDSNDPEGSDRATCRLMLAALLVSQGDLTRLRLWVEVAHQDPLDLIAAAEYPRELRDSTDEARKEDLASYLLWVAGRPGTDRPATDSG